MADDRLLNALMSTLDAGLNEKQAKERLVKEGWPPEDVNGVYALHQLSLRPIGSNVVSAWERNTLEQKIEKGSLLGQAGLVIVVFILGMVVLDWQGYDIPLIGKKRIRTFVEQYVDPMYFTTSVQANQATPKTPVQKPPEILP